MPLAAAAADLLEPHRRLLWGLCYRMTGNAADADELVQETFVRALERPPARTGEPWRPWLVRVAMNLARDLLRRRRRSPTAPGCRRRSRPAPTTRRRPRDTRRRRQPHRGRYELLESVSFAFLLALEALRPSQRAVLLLRDVFDYSVRETAEALGMSEANVKVTHLRARRAMAAYDRARCQPSRTLQARTSEALQRFMAALSSDDWAAMEALLTEDVRHLSDGGEYAAAHRPVVGRNRVMRLFFGLIRHLGPRASFSVRTINACRRCSSTSMRTAPPGARGIVRVDVAADGRIRAVHAVLASRKLTAIRF
jgi:RNA polymerase sigma-70 factor (ECF subfamily)